MPRLTILGSLVPTSSIRLLTISKAWLSDEFFNSINPNFEKSNYVSYEKKELVKNKKLIDENVVSQKFNLIDARSIERFDGKIPEPRKGLRSGNIENSF